MEDREKRLVILREQLKNAQEAKELIGYVVKAAQEMSAWIETECVRVERELASAEIVVPSKKIEVVTQ